MNYKIVTANGRMSLEKMVNEYLEANPNFEATGAPFYENGYWCQAVQKKLPDRNHESSTE